MPASIGVDVGGTKILAGVVASDGTVVDLMRSRTPGLADPPEVVERALVDAMFAAIDAHSGQKPQWEI